jgi:hypothetical protein
MHLPCKTPAGVIPVQAHLLIAVALGSLGLRARTTGIRRGRSRLGPLPLAPATRVWLALQFQYRLFPPVFLTMLGFREPASALRRAKIPVRDTMANSVGTRFGGQE